MDESGSLARVRILFVDDDRQVLKALARALHRDKALWEAHFVIGGAAALDAIRTGHYDVLVTDLCMPVVGGREVLAAAREHSPRTLRVLLTSSDVERDTIDAIEVLHKPMSIEDLRAFLARLIVDLERLR